MFKFFKETSWFIFKSPHYFSLVIWIFSWPRSKEPIFYSTLDFLFWKFWHTRIKYNKMIKYFITFLLLFHSDWSHFMLLCWTRRGFKCGWFITFWLKFQNFLHKVFFFFWKFWSNEKYNLCQNCPSTMAHTWFMTNCNSLFAMPWWECNNVVQFLISKRTFNLGSNFLCFLLNLQFSFEIDFLSFKNLWFQSFS
jgi:hypothetical protein